jgi:hypothetical protein
VEVGSWCLIMVNVWFWVIWKSIDRCKFYWAGIQNLSSICECWNSIFQSDLDLWRCSLGVAFYPLFCLPRWYFSSKSVNEWLELSTEHEVLQTNGERHTDAADFLKFYITIFLHRGGGVYKTKEQTTAANTNKRARMVLDRSTDQSNSSEHPDNWIENVTTIVLTEFYIFGKCDLDFDPRWLILELDLEC